MPGNRIEEEPRQKIVFVSLERWRGAPVTYEGYLKNPLTPQELNQLSDPEGIIPFNRWNIARYLNPVFEKKGTGIEGYFLNRNRNPEDYVERIISLGREMLDSAVRLNPFDASRRKGCSAFINEAKIINGSMLYELQAQLSALIAKLRAERSLNPDASQYRELIYKAANPNNPFMTPTISIREGIITWTYTRRDLPVSVNQLAQIGIDPNNRISVKIDRLKPSDQDPFRFVQELGRVGDTNLRCLLSHGKI